MIVNPVCSITHSTVADVDATYPVPFTYVTVLNVPQITVTLDGTELTYMTDYTLGSSGLKLTAEPEAGLELFIERTTPMTQEIDFQTGMIDPDEIEKSFDLSVMRDQEIQRDVDVIESKIPDEASPDNQLADKAYVDAHIERTDNPHSVTKAQVGLGNCNNTSDLDKPISTATQTALDLKANSADLATVATAGTLGSLDDTNIAQPAQGHFLMFDGTRWINNVSSGTVGWGGILGNIADQTDLKDALDNKVNIDGTSIMTGPLKMRAGSMQGAIAPYWDGVGFFKLNSDNSVTLLASMETPDGLCPAANNTYNIGKANYKWKDLYVARVIAGVLNNGADISVPTVGGTMARVEDIENKITNCITEIPQDINLTLSSGTLTLKAGSKVYVPNGAGVFGTVTTTQDLSITIATTGQFLIYKNPGNYINYQAITTSVSGTTDSLSGTPWHLWYDTTNNVVNRYGADGTTAMPGQSLPFAVVTVSGGAISSIDQVFNGFGYIGSKVFALPGVKCLVPNGRNADRTLKNIEVTLNTVKISINDGNDRNWFVIDNSSTINRVPSYAYVYDENENTFKLASDGAKRLFCICGTTENNITSFNVKTSFHAVDYNDFTTELGKKADVATTLAGYGITDAYTKTKSDNLLANKANTDLNNLTSTGANIGNWSSNVTNCIIEIPHDIKLELSGGTLTLKAGSKVYKPIGTFGTNDSDLTVTKDTNGTYLLVSWSLSSLELININNVFSGASQPTISSQNAIWFDTTNNVIKETYDTGSTWSGNLYFPLAIVTVSGGQISSIDQVFNGFGFIGSTEFALPGVTVLVPNGRKSDGSLNNLSTRLSTVQTLTVNGSSPIHIAIRNNGRLGWWNTSATKYNEAENFNYYNNARQYYAVVGKFDVVSNQITNFEPYTVFHAVDYSDAAVKAENNTFTGSNEFKQTVKAPSVYGYGSDGVRTASLEFIDGGNDNIARLVAVSNNGSNAVTADLHFNNGSPYFSAPASSEIGAAVTTTGITKSGNGYVKFGNGLIIQWGYDATTGNTRSETFSTAFTSTDYVIHIMPIAGGTAQLYMPHVDMANPSTTSFDVLTIGDASSVGFRWLAIGY